jgi:4-hydroxybenzoate polyprenyltransferase
MDERRGFSMVKKHSILVAVSRLIRLPNLLIIVLTQSLIRWSLIDPLLSAKGLSPQMSNWLFVTLMLATVLISAGGYVINDYFDRKIDTVNDPEDVVVGHSISLRHTMALHIVLTSLGILLGFFVAYRAHYFYLGILFLLGAGLLWFYSTTYKRQLLTGNLIVALLTAVVPLIVLLFELPLLYRSYGNIMVTVGFSFSYLLMWVGCFAGFAFLLTLAREIIKDAEDIRGDTSFGRRTLPAVAGIGISKTVVFALLAFTAVALILIYLFYLPDPYTLVYIIALLIIPLAITSVLLMKAGTAKAFHTVSILTKCIMLAGLLYTLLVNYLIHQSK